MMSIQIFIEHEALVINTEENAHKTAALTNLLKTLVVNTLRGRSILYISTLELLALISLFVNLALNIQ